ncbi:hypothetical protein CLV35_2245 [Motilibacter peucedani]|uniref:Uncharacterized protein n=1 Tax=Motilibacter peucedani TaxID=598650 RepID=A0A420XNJ2_9ACTN|nr:hypothetical protein [Motilibacter peucedani]RKS73754.1 hypothetical protein CLV35_2245 [Motilibacter peucedani]
MLRTRRLLGLVSGLLALLCALAASVAVPPAAHAESSRLVSFLALYSAPGDFVGGGVPRLYAAPHAEFSTYSEGPSYVEVRAQNPATPTYVDDVSVVLAAPAGHALVPGVFPRIASDEVSAGLPRLLVTGNGRGCRVTGGTLSIRDVAFAADGSVQRLWLSFVQYCDGVDTPLYGELKLNELVTGVVTAPDALAFPSGTKDTDFGDAAVWVLGADGLPLDVGSAAVEGPAASEFSLHSYGCSADGYAGAGCRVGVRFAPRSTGQRDAALHLVTSAGDVDVPLAGVLRPGTTALTWRTGARTLLGAAPSGAVTPPAYQFLPYQSGGTTHFQISTAPDENYSYWSLDLTAPDAGPLEVGGYEIGDGRAALSLSHASSGCDVAAGHVEVTQAVYDPVYGTLRHAALTVSGVCQAGGPQVFLDLQYEALGARDTEVDGPAVLPGWPGSVVGTGSAAWDGRTLALRLGKARAHAAAEVSVVGADGDALALGTVRLTASGNATLRPAHRLRTTIHTGDVVEVRVGGAVVLRTLLRTR